MVLGISIVFFWANDFEKRGNLAGTALMELMFVVFVCGFGILAYALHGITNPKH